MPGFMKGLTNHWRVTPKGPNASVVEMGLEAKIAFPFNILVGPLMRLQYGSVVRHAIVEMKQYAETGQPHSREVKADVSKKAKAVRATLAGA
ncbi:MAG: hypothetical protein HRU30_20775 [Rhodobacteraceae bacterium]|nr:hypothetical protein [Paracoccaceae bacterium]